MAPTPSIFVNSLKDRIWTATAKTYQPSIQNVWQEAEYRVTARGAANTEHAGLEHGIKKTFWAALYIGVRLIFVWLLLSYQ
jgi:hypothetical protein